MVDGAEALEPNQASAFVVRGKAGNTAFAMLFYSPRKVISDSAIEHATTARDHINIVGVVFAAHGTAIVLLKRTAGPSTSLRSGRDDTSGGEREKFTVLVAPGPNSSGRLLVATAGP